MAEPIYQYCLFVNNTELASLIGMLERLWRGGAGVDTRERIVNAYKEILKASIGARQVKEYVNTKTLAEVQQLVAGLPSKNPLLTKYSIADLEDRKQVSETDLRVIIGHMKESHEDLIKISGNPKHFFRSNDRSYYWVPQYILP